MTDPNLLLETRAGLPDALRHLVNTMPRESWTMNPHFGGLTQFWLQRHLMFREVLTQMSNRTDEATARSLDPQRYKADLARLGSFFVGQLHEHHNVEDHHYFPKLVRLEPGLQRGFDLLDADHHALDAHLDEFTTLAQAVLNAPAKDRAALGAFRDCLNRSHRFLDRHLVDEEEVIVPIILKHGENRIG